MGMLAAYYHKRENPMNGDGSNTTADAISGSCRLLRDADDQHRREVLTRYAERIEERVKRVGY